MERLGDGLQQLSFSVSFISHHDVHSLSEMKMVNAPEIRKREIQLIIKEVTLPKKATVLEVGCGDGIQALTLQRIASFFVASDITNELNCHIPFCKCSVESLPFKESTFHIVFSSHLLEHVNPNKALQEMKRVVKKNGEIICTVPTSLWKILQMILHYPKTIPLSILKHKKPSLQPEIHGNFQTNREELRNYEPNKWCSLIEHNGFEIRKVTKLLLYCSLGKVLRRKYNITIIPPSLHLEKITGWYSSIAIFAHKKGVAKREARTWTG